MKILKILIFAASIFAFACRTATDQAAPITVNSNTPAATTESPNSSASAPADSYEKDGVSFILRKNWKVTEDENVGSGVRYLNVEDDKTATVAITLIPVGSNPELKKFAADFLGAMKNNLSGGTLTETGDSEVVRSAANVEKKGLAKKFTVTLAGQSVPHTAELFLNKSRKFDAVIIYNAPDDEKETSDAGFETILYTLKTQ